MSDAGDGGGGKREKGWLTMKDNRGLTLVELLITIAILSIVLITATAFMVTGSNTFAKGNADSKVQKEAELAVNQMEDMIIDVNGGLDKTEDSDKAELILYNASDESGVTAYTKEVITWDKTQKQIVCSKWNVSYDTASGSYVVDGTALYENQLLAEHVTDFKVDLTDKFEETAADGSTVEIIKSVQITAACEDGSGKAAYATSPVITLRNRMMLSPNPTRIFDNTPSASDTLSLYISATGESSAVPIVDRVTEVERTKVYNIYAMIDTGHNVNDLVNWKIEEVNALSTISATGLLSVGEFEPNTYLTITASYKSNLTKKVSGVVKVVGGELKSLDAAAIVTKELTPFKPKYTSAVTTRGFSESEIAALQYTWTVSEPDMVESFIGNTKSLDLIVKQNETTYGKVFTIILTVHSDVTGQTVSDSITYRVDPEGTTGGDSNMERGRGTGEGTEDDHGKNNYTYDEPKYHPVHIITDFYFCDEYGNHISELDKYNDYVDLRLRGNPEQGAGGYALTFTKDLPPDRSYYLKVIICYEEVGTENVWRYERIHCISGVSLIGEYTTEYSQANLYGRFSAYYEIMGYRVTGWVNNQQMEYEVTLDYEAPEGITVSAEHMGTSVRDEHELKAEFAYKIDYGNSGYTEPWQVQDKIKIKSATIKVSMKDYPSIYAYSTVIFP